MNSPPALSTPTRTKWRVRLVTTYRECFLLVSFSSIHSLALLIFSILFENFLYDHKTLFYNLEHYLLFFFGATVY